MDHTKFIAAIDARLTPFSKGIISFDPMLAYRDLSPEEKEVRRKYSREYAAKRRRESEASLIEAKNEYDRNYSVLEYQNEEIKGRRRFRNWVYQSHVPLWSRRGS
jgi:hypothetical protein